MPVSTLPGLHNHFLYAGTSVVQVSKNVQDASYTVGTCVWLDSFAVFSLAQASPPAKASTELRSPNSGCLAYVLRTGFATQQVWQKTSAGTA